MSFNYPTVFILNPRAYIDFALILFIIFKLGCILFPFFLKCLLHYHSQKYVYECK